MTASRFMVVTLSAIALAMAVGSAHAQAAPAGMILVANDFSTQGAAGGYAAPRRSLEWDSRKGRWGLKLGVEQHLNREADWRDVSPGLYYRLTPRLHIGGAVSLAPDQLDGTRPLDPQTRAPRVRLETTFKF